jgi:predicted ATPase/class 3 adenylate cyclase
VAELPTGTVTFLFTDLETSTRLWEEQPDGVMGEALARHDAIVRGAIEAHHGVVFATMGDGMAAAFASAPDALAAALDAQLGLDTEAWGEAGALRARMGLHSDEGRLRAPGEYVNRPLNRCARLMAVGHGGQVLLSDATAALVRRALSPDVGLVDLGEHRLRDLADAVRVFQAVHPELRSEFPPLRSLELVPGNLPRQVTTFIGREREMARLGALVRERPLVTLTGVGGVGKTRLALQVAAEVGPEFADGAWLCELAPVTDAGGVWDTLAASLGVHSREGRPLEATVLDFLGSKRLLIVLDNCEHLLDEVARVVDAINQRCPSVAVLATSREGLALAGEHLVAVPALGLPADGADPDAFAHSEAVHLFCDRAHDAKPGFTLTSQNSAAVAQLCRRLDGIPLAIELAAARVRSLPPEDLVARLDQRFRLLTRGSRAALERHQTLRNTIDWSYDLLTPVERVALNRLSVFAGGCDLTAAEAVLAADDVDTADVVDVMSQLVDKSLVDVDEQTVPARYRLLETIRQYAQDRLEASGETASVRRRHADYFVALAETAGPHLRSRDQIEWAAAVARDSENFVAALDWAVEAPSADHALRLVTPLMVTGIPTGWTVTDWADTARSVPGAETHHLFPLAVAYAAMGTTMRGDLERAGPLVTTAREAQAALGTEHLWVHAAAGVFAFFSGDLDETTRHAQAWVDGARRTGDPYEIAQALILLATALIAEPARASVVAEEAVRIAHEASIPGTLLYASFVVANLPSDDPTQVLALLDEAADAATKLGDRQGLASVDAFRGIIAARIGDWRAALRASANAAELHFNADSALFGLAVWGTAFALARLGELEPAARLIGFAEARSHFRRLPDPQGDATTAEIAAMLTHQLGEQRVAQMKAEGATLDLAAAIAYLRTESGRVLDD